MAEVKVKEGEELNGLGKMLKDLIDGNLKNPKKYKAIKKLKGSFVIKETLSDVSVTLHFQDGEIEIQNDAIDKPDAYMASDFETQAYISSGQLNPTIAMLKGKVKGKGNLLKLLKLSRSKIMILD